MADAIVVVAGEAEEVLYPEPERHLRVRVVPAEHQDAGVDEQQAIDERCEAEARVRRNQDRSTEEHGGDFEHPRDAVMRPNAREGEQPHADGQQDGRFAPAVLLVGRADDQSRPV